MQNCRLMPIQNETHFDRKLTKAVLEHNAKLVSLDTLENDVPNRKRDLARRVLAGEIGGADALAELREINNATWTVEVDRAQLYVERQRLSPLVTAAHEAESKRLLTLAEKRKVELVTKMDEAKLSLTPSEKQLAVSRDGEYRAAFERGRSLQIKAGSGTLHPDAVGGWPSAFAGWVAAHIAR